MYGLGNDFIVLDARKDPSISSASEAKRATRLTDRKYGIGCDQLIILEAKEDATCGMRIINADGSEVGACGNATRCIGGLLFEEDASATEVTIRTQAGLLRCTKGGGPDIISVNMGAPGLKWSEVPVASECDTLHCKDAVEGGGLTDCACCSMGNPHATFFVDDCEKVPLPEVGHSLEHHAFFPERCNVSAVTVSKDKKSIRMRVWERGTGMTEACGTGACATLVNAVRRGFIGKEQNYTAEVVMDGGSLTITYAPPGSGADKEGVVIMSGAYATAFSGEIPAALWG
jgi:diaminopimelate epimerase